MKSTLKRELNSTWNCWKRSAGNQTRSWSINVPSGSCTRSFAGQHQLRRWDKGLGNVALFWECYSSRCNAASCDWGSRICSDAGL